MSHDTVRMRAELEARQAPLKLRFIERCQAELAQFPGYIDRAAAGEAEAATQLLQLTHRMAGTGATLGFEALSDAARELELLLADDAPAALADPGRCAAARDGVHKLIATLGAAAVPR